MKQVNTISFEEFLSSIKCEDDELEVYKRLVYSRWISSMTMEDDSVLVTPYTLTIWFLHNGFQAGRELDDELFSSWDNTFVILNSSTLQLTNQEVQ